MFEGGPTEPLMGPLLAEQFRRFCTIFDSMNVIVYVSDMETYELLFTNEHVEDLFGKNIIGKRCYETLQTGQTAPCSFCTNSRLVGPDGEPAPPVVWEFQNTVTRRWFLCVDRAIRWTNGRLVRMEVAVDITDRKETEHFREQFVALVSHDLRNPLSIIALKAEHLRRSLESRGLGQEAEVARSLIQTTRRMDAMIQEMLTSVRLESGQLELARAPVDLVDVARDAIRGTTPADHARVRFEPGATGGAFVLGDREHLQRVIENLLGNAFKYAPPRTPVGLTVSAAGDELVVAVSDSGPGVDAAEQARIFDRFYRATSGKKTAEGLGLGLYISRMIVEAHGGRIGVESRPGQGSTFSFHLPLVR